MTFPKNYLFIFAISAYKDLSFPRFEHMENPGTMIVVVKCRFYFSIPWVFFLLIYIFIHIFTKMAMTFCFQKNR